jgi:hypothetical protein
METPAIDRGAGDTSRLNLDEEYIRPKPIDQVKKRLNSI